MNKFFFKLKLSLGWGYYVVSLIGRILCLGLFRTGLKRGILPHREEGAFLQSEVHVQEFVALYIRFRNNNGSGLKKQRFG
jgi:hypothetical protein